MARRGSLRAYVLARLLLALPMLLILLTATFVLLRVAPGDPVTATLGDRVSDARADQIRHDLGLDRPLWQQYSDYLADVGHRATSGGPSPPTGPCARPSPTASRPPSS